MRKVQQTDGSGIRNDKQPNIRYAFGDPLYRWSFASVAVFPDQEVRWLYERKNMKELKKKYKDVITLCKRKGLSPEDALILVKAGMIRSKLIALHNARLIALGPLPNWKKIKEKNANR
jgi:hypothetical protein